MSGVINVALASKGLGDYIFGLDVQLLFDTAITLLAMFTLFVALSYLLFNPARDLLEKRKQHIREQLDSAAKDKKDAEQSKAQYDAKLKNVEKEAEEILTQSRQKALRKENDIVNEAKEEANRIMQRADREVELEKAKVKDQVKQEMVSVASAMAGKIVANSLDEETQAQLIEDTLKEMGDSTWQS